MSRGRADFQLGQNLDSFPRSVTRGLDNLEERDLIEKYRELRMSLRRHQTIYQNCSRKMLGHSKRNTKALEDLKVDEDMAISHIKKQSIYIIYKLSKMTGFSSMDLHGLTLQESIECIVIVIDQILRELVNSSHKR